jgi:hypothetical protein
MRWSRQFLVAEGREPPRVFSQVLVQEVDLPDFWPGTLSG